MFTDLFQISENKTLFIQYTHCAKAFSQLILLTEAAGLTLEADFTNPCKIKNCVLKLNWTDLLLLTKQ